MGCTPSLDNGADTFLSDYMVPHPHKTLMFSMLLFNAPLALPSLHRRRVFPRQWETYADRMYHQFTAAKKYGKVMMIKCSYDIHWLKSELKLPYNRAYSTLNCKWGGHEAQIFMFYLV
jgi:hypothetical protein